MTKTLVALVLIAGGILLVTRLVDTDKPVPARLSPPMDADQISEARRVSPSMSARDVCDLIDPWQKCSFSKPNIMVVDPKITTQAAAASLCNEFVVAVRGMRKVGEPMEPGWTLHVHSSKGELASCYLLSCIAALHNSTASAETDEAAPKESNHAHVTRSIRLRAAPGRRVRRTNHHRNCRRNGRGDRARGRDR